ncbi:MAG: CoA-binding protein [Clostridiales bacterium]|nr:MAG: CoA-binding protein [Clostridiales bacterium]
MFQMDNVSLQADSMDKTIEEMFAQKNWAVVGANGDATKFGNRIYKRLMQKQHNVFLVNPKRDEIDGHKVYHTILDIAEDIDCISMVVAKNVARAVVEKAIQKKVKYIWFQPNTYDMDIVKYAQENGIKVVHGSCVLVKYQ